LNKENAEKLNIDEGVSEDENSINIEQVKKIADELKKKNEEDEKKID
jgi:hypothetical protein